MRVSGFDWQVPGCCAAAAMLAGCALGQRFDGVYPQHRNVILSAVEGRAGAGRSTSWMLPEAKRDKLLYVSDAGNNTVTVYSYPRGRQVGTLGGFDFPYGQCVDKAGDVFIANTNASNIIEYPHGSSSPIATIGDAGEHPAGCSVDPLNGDLAVNNTYTVSNEPGSISRYTYSRHYGWSLPKNYSDSSFFYMYFCGYDATGDLFVDGLTGYGGSFVFAELPAGHKTFTNITLNQSIQSPGGVQWDGAHMAVGDQGNGNGSVIYQFTFSGNTGKAVGSTPLNGSEDVAQFWIQGRKVVGPDYGSGEVEYWNYPAGGSAINLITRGVDGPEGATVSEAQTFQSRSRQFCRPSQKRSSPQCGRS